jgi:hypothetical protein
MGREIVVGEEALAFVDELTNGSADDVGQLSPAAGDSEDSDRRIV